MENLELYQDIAKRTDGDIYVGVVGPVRTGKSTFIKNVLWIYLLFQTLKMNTEKKGQEMNFHKVQLVELL